MAIPYAQVKRVTRQVLIDPLLVALGWDVSDPNLVELEYSAGQGRADYALLGAHGPVAVVEAKRLGENLDDRHVMQVLNYANSQGIGYMIVCNGDEWRMYDVFQPAQLTERLMMELKIGTLSSHVNALKSLRLWRANLSSGSSPTKASEPAFGLPEAPSPLQPKPATETSTNDDADQYDERWCSLGDLSVQKRDKPPAGTRLGTESIEISPNRNWTHYFVGFAKWLVSSGYLDKANCPISLHENSNMYLVSENPVHPSGREFDSREEIGGGLWIEKNLDTPGKLRSLKYLLADCGVDPHTVWVRVD